MYIPFQILGNEKKDRDIRWLFIFTWSMFSKRTCTAYCYLNCHRHFSNLISMCVSSNYQPPSTKRESWALFSWELEKKLPFNVCSFLTVREKNRLLLVGFQLSIHLIVKSIDKQMKRIHNGVVSIDRLTISIIVVWSNWIYEWKKWTNVQCNAKRHMSL